MVLGATSGLVTPRSLGKVGASNKHQSEKISTNRGIGTERDSGAADVECSEIRLVRSKSHDEIRSILAMNRSIIIFSLCYSKSFKTD